MSGWTQIVVLSVLWAQWPRSVGQIVDSPIFTDTISISITPSTQIVMPSTAVLTDVCPPVDEIPDGSFTYISPSCSPVIQLDCVVSYTCNEGYYLTGDVTRTCNIFGWHRPSPSCEPVECGLPDLSGGYATPSDQFGYGTVVIFECNINYIIEGEREATCQQDGTWSGERQCIYECESLSISNGTANFDCQQEGCIANYTCNEDQGFTMVGENQRICVQGVGWTGSDPFCTQVTAEHTANLVLTFPEDEVDMESPTLAEDVYEQLYDKLYAQLGDSLHALVVNRILLNGTIDFEVVIEDTRQARRELSAAFAGIARGELFDLQGTNVSSQISTLDEKTVLLADPSTIDRVSCETLAHLDGPCPMSEPCSVIDGLPDCREPVTVEDNLLLILLLAVGLPAAACLLGICVCCCCWCCCIRPPAADDDVISEDEQPIMVKGFLPRYRYLGFATRFNNAGMQGPIYGYSGTDRFSTPPTTHRSTDSSDTSDSPRTSSSFGSFWSRLHREHW